MAEDEGKTANDKIEGELLDTDDPEVLLEVKDGKGKIVVVDDGPTDVETLAAGMGWAPETDWRGDPEKWVDAATFIRQGPEILKSTLKSLDRTIADQSDTMKRMARAQDSIQQKDHASDLATLKAKQREAAGEGDVGAYDAATAEIDALAKTAPAKVESNGADRNSVEDPGYQAFLAANSWYGPDGDYEMTLAAEDAAKVISRTYEGAALYERITAEMKRKFPDRFGNKERRNAPRVEGGGSTNRKPKGGKKGYADLPPDAKAACDNFVAGGKSTQESYCKTFFAEDAA